MKLDAFFNCINCSKICQSIPVWDYERDQVHPEFCLSTMRSDMFVTSFHPVAPDQDGNSPITCYPKASTEYLADDLVFLFPLFTRGGSCHEVGFSP